MRWCIEAVTAGGMACRYLYELPEWPLVGGDVWCTKYEMYLRWPVYQKRPKQELYNDRWVYFFHHHELDFGLNSMSKLTLTQ